MAWMRVETSVARNRKFVKAGPAPSWLWLCGLAYCQEGLTDGFIPTESLAFLGVKNARQLAHHLVSAGLWDEADGGWYVHDYLAYNKPADEIRRVTEERRNGGRLGGRPTNLQGKPSDIEKVNLPENPSVHRSEVDRSKVDQQESAEPQGDSSPAILVFPVIGDRRTRTWPLTQERIEGWALAYPGLDVLAECRKAHAWVEANRPKTAKGMPAFLVRWLSKATNNGHGRSTPHASRHPEWLQEPSQ